MKRALLSLALSSFAPAADAADGLPAVCATPETRGRLAGTAVLLPAGGADCSASSTTPATQYLPAKLWHLPIVVHVLMDSSCTQGAVSDETVQEQIAILKGDFRSLPGTNGDPGIDTRIQFELATVDPDDNPTNGITRSCNTSWYNDQGAYWDTLAWDPNRYVNLYTNTANGARGYVPFLPAVNPELVGTSADRVVINHLAFGTGGPVPTHADGRTSTHELGHYLGLYHPYFNGCGVEAPPGCYTTGDLLCDTPPDANSHAGCDALQTSCGGVPVPVTNYMELTDDLCMAGFTLEQAQRMRCTLPSFRPLLGFKNSDRQ
ncbi:MAG: M43 family zinc metalloprotease [Vicinamibacteria bacterium]